MKSATALLVSLTLTACAGTSEDPDTSTDEVDCATLALSECDSEPGCGLQVAQRLSSDGTCFTQDTEPVACDASDIGSGGAVTVQRDPDGTCWLFSSTYTPAGWTDMDSEVSANCPDSQTPTCSE